MVQPLSRRDALKALALPVAAGVGSEVAQEADACHLGIQASREGWVVGRLTGAEALVKTLLAEGAEVVFGIPGAQASEVWDAMKSLGLGYLLVTHEFSASSMADGYARATGRPGILFVVPGPGLTNSLSGLGEALLDSVPLVCLVTDVARGPKYRPFQVHEIAPLGLLQPVTKQVLCVNEVREIPAAVREAHSLACCGEPGPVAVLLPYHLFVAADEVCSPALPPPAVPFDASAFRAALPLLANRRHRVGIYAGLGCMDVNHQLVSAAELLQAPVATSVSGKGVIAETHPLAVGWGYGPQATRTAEQVFREIDVVLAIGVRFSEMSTAFSLPSRPHLIHVDVNQANLGRGVCADVAVHADAGVFLAELHAHADALRRPCDRSLLARIATLKGDAWNQNLPVRVAGGVDPMAFLIALRAATCPDALVYVDVTACEHWAAEVYTVCQPRTYFSPTDNQSMGWSIPASLGGQRAFPTRQTVTVTGDGCFLMSASEISTAAREQLPVKFFVLDNQAYHYMQAVQKPAYLRTTATVLARLDYAALARGFGVGYQEICQTDDLPNALRTALCLPGPVLTRVAVDYPPRKIRWIEAAKTHFRRELSLPEKLRFAARLGARALRVHQDDD